MSTYLGLRGEMYDWLCTNTYTCFWQVWSPDIYVSNQFDQLAYVSDRPQCSGSLSQDQRPFVLSPSSKVIEDKSNPLRPCVTCLHNVLMKNWQKTKKTKGNGSDDFYLIQIDVSLWSSHLYSIFSVMKTAELKEAFYLNDLPWVQWRKWPKTDIL